MHWERHMCLGSFLVRPIRSTPRSMRRVPFDDRRLNPRHDTARFRMRHCAQTLRLRRFHKRADCMSQQQRLQPAVGRRLRGGKQSGQCGICRQQCALLSVRESRATTRMRAPFCVHDGWGYMCLRRYSTHRHAANLQSARRGCAVAASNGLLPGLVKLRFIKRKPVAGPGA
jgi:hypothetical protein